MNSMKQEAKDMKAEAKAVKKAEKAAKKKEKKIARKRKAHLNQNNMFFDGKHLLKGQTLQSGNNKWNVKGATAVVETEYDLAARMTATRIVTGAVLFGPVGAIIGGMAKKDPSTLLITITFPNGKIGTITTRKKNHPQADKFARAINMAAKH